MTDPTHIKPGTRVVLDRNGFRPARDGERTRWVAVTAPESVFIVIGPPATSPRPTRRTTPHSEGQGDD